MTKGTPKIWCCKQVPPVWYERVSLCFVRGNVMLTLSSIDFLVLTLWWSCEAPLPSVQGWERSKALPFSPGLPTHPQFLWDGDCEGPVSGGTWHRQPWKGMFPTTRKGKQKWRKTLIPFFPSRGSPISHQRNQLLSVQRVKCWPIPAPLCLDTHTHTQLFSISLKPSVREWGATAHWSVLNETEPWVFKTEHVY